MSWIKLVLLNIVFSFSLLGALFFLPPFVDLTYKIFFKDLNHDRRANLPNYEGISWAHKHFEEFSELTSTYFDYVTWRRDDFSGETINIVGGLRKTIKTNKELNDSSEVFWFFGGSTTWGSGVDDANTYPSIFSSLTGLDSLNFGESGYVARQSLSFLQNEYISKNKISQKKRIIVFYDGVNDVANNCLKDLIGLDTPKQIKIRKELKASKDGLSFYSTFKQLILFFNLVSERLKGQTEEFYDCSSNEVKANFVADSLVNSWIQASKLAEANGDTFIAILQPVAFIGNPNISYLNLKDTISKELKVEYDKLYPLISEKAEKANLTFFDLTDIYDKCEICYIDFCHVSPNGNKILATKLIDIFTEKKIL